MTQRLAIVGGDAAGMSAASTAKRRDPDLEVVAFERGPYTSYSACGIPYFLGGVFEDSDRLVARSPDEHREHGIEVHTRTEVTAIDLGARRLTVRDQAGAERTERFDQLVIATGAEAVPPDIPGAEAIEPASTIGAAERLDTSLRRRGDAAVVVGAGYIGLEMAEALVQRGLRVTLAERAPQIMSTLDEDMAAHVQDAAEGIGIRVLLGAEVEAIEVGDDGAPRAVRLASRARRWPPTTSSWAPAPGPPPRSPPRRGSRPATAAGCASMTISAARVTTACSRQATASNRGIACCGVR
jgi:NADPH-dependent 2,4-dienoyl-CoA reductase/sulfur reductase-like enzyme